jgi:hypothetical protein
MSDEIEFDVEGEEPEEEFVVEEILDEEDRAYVMDYLTAEIKEIEEGGEQESLLKDLAKWRRQREARPEQEVKDYPWPNASNVVTPLSMMNTNGIYALLKSSFSVRKPFWTVEGSTRAFHEQAKAAEALLDALAESPYHLDLRKVNNTLLYELASIGTQVAKVPWLIDKRIFKRRAPGGAYETVTQTVKDSPAVIPVKREDFLIHSYWADIQRAPWVAHRVHLMEHELMQKQALGIYENVEDVLLHEEDVDPQRAEGLSRAGVNPSATSATKTYDIYEVYMFYDVDDDGIPEDLIVWIHPESGVVLRTEFNDLGVRPFVRLPYLNRPFEFNAIGVGWMSEHLQDEIDALHNMRIDGTHIASLQMYVTRRGGGLAAGETFRPLKNIQVDAPREDFVPVTFPDISPSTVQAEMMAKEYADRATGASDAMMGFENPATSSRTTATGTMFLAQQGSKMFNAIQENVEDGFSEMGMLVLYQVIRNAERAEGLRNLIPEDLQPALDSLLETPLEEIPNRFRFRVQTTEPEKTEDAKRQNVLTLTQLYSVYIDKLLQMAQMMESQEVPPKMKEAVTNFYVGLTKLMGKTLDNFGEVEHEDYLPYVKDIEMMLEHLQTMKDSQVKAVQDVRENGAGVRPSAPGGPGGGGAVRRPGMAAAEGGAPPQAAPGGQAAPQEQ